MIRERKLIPHTELLRKNTVSRPVQIMKILKQQIAVSSL